jgi:hypothetical protein
MEVVGKKLSRQVAEGRHGWGHKASLGRRLVRVEILGAKLEWKLLVVAMARGATRHRGIASSLLAQAVHDLVAAAALAA